MIIMKKKIYRVCFIYENYISDIWGDFNTDDYQYAYSEVIRYMKNNKDIVSSLIYSNKNTAIVIQRKYADSPIIIKRAWSSSGKKTITFTSDLMGSPKWAEFKKLLVGKLGKNWGYDTATTLKISKDIAHFTVNSFNT